MNWPHQAGIGNDCDIEENISFIFVGPWEPGRSIVIGNSVFIGRYCEFNVCGRVEIGDDALVASGCKFIDHDHGILLDLPIKVQPNQTSPIRIEDGAWLGVNVSVLKGVTIGAGAVVNKDVPSGEIWDRIPARKIERRIAESAQ